MEWEDLFDEYGYSDDPDGVLVESRPISGGGFGDDIDGELFIHPPWEDFND